MLTVACGRPPDVANSVLDVHGDGGGNASSPRHAPGTHLTYTCLAGFVASQLRTNQTLACSADGAWEAPEDGGGGGEVIDCFNATGARMGVGCVGGWAMLACLCSWGSDSRHVGGWVGGCHWLAGWACGWFVGGGGGGGGPRGGGGGVGGVGWGGGNLYLREVCVFTWGWWWMVLMNTHYTNTDLSSALFIAYGSVFV